ncbi:MAG: NUDIX hydrolase, partial [Ottowia sp.]
VLEETAYDFTPSALVGVYLNRFRRTRTGDDITYLRFVFTGQLGEHHPWRDLDDGIVRAVWLTPDELRSSRTRHRSPLVLQSVNDYLAAQRAPLGLIHTDASVLQPPR